MPPVLHLKRLINLSAAFVIMMMASATVWADPITITTGNPGNQGTDTRQIGPIECLDDRVS